MASIDELWLVDFGPVHPAEPSGVRPALIVGPPETFGDRFPIVIVVPLTTKRHGLSIHVEVEPGRGTGLDETSYAQCELIRSVNSRRLTHRLGVVDIATHVAVSDVLRTLLNH